MLKTTRRTKLMLLVMATVVVGAIFISLNLHNDSKRAPSAKCSSTGATLLMPLPPMPQTAHESASIILAEQQGEVADGFYFRVKEDLKGGYAKKGDLIHVCANIGKPDKDYSYNTTLLFIDGLDDNTWVPMQFEMGVLPQKKDGTYRMSGSQSFTLDDLKRTL